MFQYYMNLVKNPLVLNPNTTIYFIIIFYIPYSTVLYCIMLYYIMIGALLRGDLRIAAVRDKGQGVAGH